MSALSSDTVSQDDIQLLIRLKSLQQFFVSKNRQPHSATDAHAQTHTPQQTHTHLRSHKYTLTVCEIYTPALRRHWIWTFFIFHIK